MLNDVSYVCQGCADENYSKCDECEELCDNDEILYLDNCEVSLCEDCRGV